MSSENTNCIAFQKHYKLANTNLWGTTYTFKLVFWENFQHCKITYRERGKTTSFEWQYLFVNPTRHRAHVFHHQTDKWKFSLISCTICDKFSLFGNFSVTNEWLERSRNWQPSEVKEKDTKDKLHQNPILNLLFYMAGAGDKIIYV